MRNVGIPPAEAFFHDAEPGYRFCLYQPPVNTNACRGGIVYVAPFAEEMNNARHIAALQARALAAGGYGVLLLDLFGCGDSSGELRDVTWSDWKNDVKLAIRILQTKIGETAKLPVNLLGLRLGALLALDIARSANEAAAQFDKIILWQPVLQGATFLNQFFRLRVASDMLSGGEKSEPQKTVKQLLDDGQTVEIAGYEITPALADSIMAMDATHWRCEQSTVHWLECLSDTAAGMPPARQKLLKQWQENGIDIHAQTVVCPQFWLAPEALPSEALIATTTQLFSN